MSPTPIRTLTFVLAAAALLAAGCAKKKTPVESAPVPPASQPTTPTPTPTPTTSQEPPTPASPAASVSDLSTVYFALDSYSLDDAAKAALDKDAKLLREHGWTVTIGGHCDERGTVEYNQALGERRAGAVKDFLVAAGVDAAKLRLVSYGKEMPAVDGHDDTAWAKNRRAEFAR